MGIPSPSLQAPVAQYTQKNRSRDIYHLVIIVLPFANDRSGFNHDYTVCYLGKCHQTLEVTMFKKYITILVTFFLIFSYIGFVTAQYQNNLFYENKKYLNESELDENEYISLIVHTEEPVGIDGFSGASFPFFKGNPFVSHSVIPPATL